jgi:hypothetical protein
VPSTKERESERESGIGRGFVPRGWLIALTLFMLALEAVVPYSL